MSDNSHQDTPIILDIEASGFGTGSYPIEVGIALPDKSTHCYLVKPIDDWTHWNMGAEEVHGISRALLIEKGRPLDEVANHLNHYLSSKTVYSDGWGYDMSWLTLLFERANIRMDFKIETLYTLLHDDQLVLWEKMRLQVIEDLGIKRHRASSDARIIQETYIRTRDILREQTAGTQ